MNAKDFSSEGSLNTLVYFSILWSHIHFHLYNTQICFLFVWKLFYKIITTSFSVSLHSSHRLQLLFSSPRFRQRPSVRFTQWTSFYFHIHSFTPALQITLLFPLRPSFFFLPWPYCLKIFNSKNSFIVHNFLNNTERQNFVMPRQLIKSF